MARALTALLIAGCIISAGACATSRGYVICNDMGNETCPDNTANVVVGM